MRKQNSCREVSYNFKGFALSWIIKIDPKHLGILTEGLWACCFWAVGKRMWLRHYQWPTLGVFIASEHRADGSRVRRQCTRPGIRADSRVSQSVLWGPSAESVAWEGRLILVQTLLLTASPHVILLHSSLENCFPKAIVLNDWPLAWAQLASWSWAGHQSSQSAGWDDWAEVGNTTCLFDSQIFNYIPSFSIFDII